MSETPELVLHPETEKLIGDFADALRAKLLAAQKKYGWTNEWARDDWQSECQQRLLDHLGKGDPRDVAAYCAFLWFHQWPTAADAITALQEKVRRLEIALTKCRELFTEIRNDWTDPRSECREGWAIIEAALNGSPDQ